MTLRSNKLKEIFYGHCTDFGFTSPTLLQQVIPVFAAAGKKRDLVIESSSQDGNLTAGLLLHLVRSAWEERQAAISTGKSPSRKQEDNTTSRLMLVPGELLAEITLFVDENLSAIEHLSIGIIGTNGNVRGDLPLLREGAELIISTPGRIIDHVRRGNLELSTIKEVTIIDPDPVSQKLREFTHGKEVREQKISYNHDIEFVFTKFEKQPLSFIFTGYVDDQEDDREYLNRPQIIKREQWGNSRKILHHGSFSTIYPAIIRDTVYSRQITEKILIICSDANACRNIERSMEPDRGIIDFEVCPAKPELPGIYRQCAIFFYGLKGRKQELEMLPMLACNPYVTHFFCLGTDLENKFCRLLEEQFIMKNSVEENPKKELVTAGKIKMILEQIRTDRNPEELQNMRRIIRKNVPFFMRMYLAAYLLRDSLDPVQEKAKSGNGGRQRKNTPKTQTADGTTLFISLGKNRRVYPKDLAALITEKSGISQDDILSVKVLEKYSFVTVTDGVAKKVINSVHNISFKGRPVTCDLSKKGSKN